MKAPHSVNAPHFGRTVNAPHFGRKLNENVKWNQRPALCDCYYYAIQKSNGINARHLVIVITTQYKSSSLFVTSLGGLQIVRVPRKGLQFVRRSQVPQSRGGGLRRTVSLRLFGGIEVLGARRV
jgi:hypothetical protein